MDLDSNKIIHLRKTIKQFATVEWFLRYNRHIAADAEAFKFTMFINHKLPQCRRIRNFVFQRIVTIKYLQHNSSKILFNFKIKVGLSSQAN